MKKRILITGGAGFVGSNIGLFFKRDYPDWDIIALDNLKRRGSELALSRLSGKGILFIHGDIRNSEDLLQIGPVDIIVESSAEPSVKAGYGGNSRYLINTNLLGTINCLEYAKEHDTAIIFLSTSRVYSIEKLRNLPLVASETRFLIPDSQKGLGWSKEGITADFSIEGHRSLYGATKLCSELLIHEYINMYDLQAIIDRCGVLTGPWQMGKVDQGFVTLWAAKHTYGGDLSYIGFGGNGLQVRDILHIEDLYDLLKIQINNIHKYKGKTFNVGGGKERSLSLIELTNFCREISEKIIEIKSDPDTHPSDIPFYVSDNNNVIKQTGWKPLKSIKYILEDIFNWLIQNENILKNIL